MKFQFEGTEYMIAKSGTGYWKQHQDDRRWPYIWVEDTLAVHRAHDDYQAELDADLLELEDLQATQDDASYRSQ